MTVAPALRAVVFDLDDTLTDHRSLQLEVEEEIVRLVCGQVPEAEAEEFSRRHLGSLTVLYDQWMRGELDEPGYHRARLADALAPWHVPGEQLVADYTELKRRMITEVRRAEGAAEAVAAVRAAGLRVGVLTNGMTDLQRDKLGRIGLGDAVDVFAASQDVGAVKPDPDAFAAVAERLGVGPHETAMVGDNPVNDIVGALDAGWAAAVLVAVDPPPLDLPTEAAVVTSVGEAPLALGLPA
ncbi:MAG: putative hydrolase of the superfamily [Solirubrobacteraceae bacterium]|jgi:putative hydrolase of the HAD superfamily|nr:putative hydrolase of the superfamily [Solirubrobacteraceae bacterium]